MPNVGNKTMGKKEDLRTHCWDKSFHSFGTGSIFENRAKKLGKKLIILKFLGILVPILLGALFTSYGVNWKYLTLVLFIASIISIFQLIGSVWALVSDWDNEYAYSKESASMNNKLSQQYKKLAETPPRTIEKFETEIELLDSEDAWRSNLDIQHHISEKEKRYGMRSALRNFQRKCSGCNEVPSTMKPSDCGVCGNF